MQRLTLSNEFLSFTCVVFYEDFLYMDLHGRFVEDHLKRRVDDDDLTAICRYLHGHRKVIVLDLGYNNITDHGFSYLAYYLAQDTYLRSLNLMHNEIATLHMNVLKVTVPFWRLKCLKLAGNKFGTEGGIAIAKLLRFTNSLGHLDIAETDQTIQSVSHIIGALLPNRDGCKTIKKIDLNRMLLTRTQESSSAMHLCKLINHAFLYNETLFEIHLAKNGITDFDLELMLEGLGKNKVLQFINLNCNLLTSRGLELLCTILPQSNIKYLLISANSIGTDGALALGRIFGQTKIKYLDISYNKIDDVGLVNLVWGLKCKNPPVHTFMIYGNPFTSKAATIVYNQVSQQLMSPFALDIVFRWDDEGQLYYAQDSGVNIYRNIYYLVHDYSMNQRKIHHSCCYQPSDNLVVNKKNAQTLHIPWMYALQRNISILQPSQTYPVQDNSITPSPIQNIEQLK